MATGGIKILKNYKNGRESIRIFKKRIAGYLGAQLFKPVAV